MVLERFKFNFSYKATVGLLYKLNILLIVALIIGVITMFFTTDGIAAGLSLNTSIPAKSYNIPSSNLGKALATYSAQAGVVLVFDPILTDGKTSDGLQGNYGLGEGFAAVLKGSGLEVVADGNGEYTLKRSPKETSEGKNLPEQISLKETVVRSKRFYEIGPLPGLGLTKEQIPGNVQSISAKEIQESHALSLTDLMNKKLQSVNVNDYQGNPFQMDVTYRGFTAGPQIGTPQGLSVFFDGIRVNEPFGDVVNWDMIPMNALASVDVFPGSNPIFGLNTLGGAFTVKTKDGFNHEGVNAEVLTGSYGRKQLQVTGGWNNGTVALFGAGNFFLEDGWRENSPSRVNQAFGKASYRGEKLDLNVSTLLVQTDLVGNGLLPSEMYKQNRDGSFTSEDTTKNKLAQFQLSSSYFVSDTFTITGQVYRRDSERKQRGADVYTEFGDKPKNRNLKPGEEFTCVYNSTGQAAKYGLPDYYVLNIANPSLDPRGEFYNDFLVDYFGQAMGSRVPNIDLPNGYTTDPLTGIANPAAQVPGGLPTVRASFNQELPANVVAAFTNNFNYHKNFDVSNYSNAARSSGDITSTQTTPEGDVLFQFLGFEFNRAFAQDGSSEPNSNINPDALIAYYYDVDAQGNVMQDNNGYYVKHAVVFLKPDNAQNCLATQFSSATGQSDRNILTELDPVTNQPIKVDGLYQNSGKAPGVVEGTPTAVLNTGLITQITDGASLQLNWNFPKHKFMVGASIDSSHAEYANEQKLGILDATRKASLNPDAIRDEYAAKTIGVSNNDFVGSNITKSIYASETWSPIETLHITSAMRYNDTQAKIKLATRTLGDQFNDISNFYATPDTYNLAINGVRPATGYKIPDLSNVLTPGEKEKHSYYSLNPSLGVSWQAKENLNIFGNLAQGTRTPSVIELGCAFDHTLINRAGPGDPPKYYEKSLGDGRGCQLPNALAGDPHLPQIKATTYDIGMRGTFANFLGAENIEWNLGAYRTDLKDDIYLITFPGNQSFFDTIGNTRRQGIEAGMSASFGKTKLRLNYALTDATFQSTFDMAADDNSSATRPVNGQYCNSTGTCTYSDPEDDVGRIRVKPGNRMPGVPLHNLNATLSYDLTSKWQVGITAIAHSGAFLRGNENNQHEQGKAITVSVPVYDASGAFTGAYQLVPRQPSTNPGKLDGYATFNFQTSYRLSDEWTATLLVNNLLDKEYFSAGRLGRNPFSPSINGAIGPDGYNHNSGDWLSTNFIAPAAPRGVWVSLRYEFSPDKK